MTTNQSCFQSDRLRRTVRYSVFVWAAILLSCFAAIAQTNSGAGDKENLIENAAPPPRKALVIVAADYVNIRTLPSANQDGVKVSEKLVNLGFSVCQSFNDPATKVWTKIRNFQKTLEEGDLAVVYFSGHGFQHKGLNFFAPVDVPETLFEGTDNMTAGVVPISDVIDRLSNMKVGLGFIILDACRENTLSVQSREGILKSVGRDGFAPQRKPEEAEILIAYAADFGQISIAYKDPDKNSLYTRYLIENIDNKGQDITQILRFVIADLRSDCKCDQNPRVDMGSGTFYPNPSDDNKKLLKESWVQAYKTQDARIIMRFLRFWPVSEYSASARQWLVENRSKVPSGGTFALEKKRWLVLIPWGFSVIKGENLTPAPVTTTEGSSKGQLAIVAADELKVFGQPISSAEQIATVPIGETVSILDPSDSKEKSDKGTSIWSKISIKTGKNSQLVGYVKDAVRIDEHKTYNFEYVIQLKPTNAAGVLEGEVLVKSLDGEDLAQPISLTDAIASQSSGPLNQSVLSQSSILVKLHNYIEGAQSVQVARQFSNLRRLQIRDALIGSGAKKENIFIEEPKVFLLGGEGKPDYDQVSIFLAK